jgi:hypothetical protein
MSKTKLILRVNTIGASAGDEIEVDADTAQALVDNGHAFRKADAPAQPKKG